MAIIGGLIGRTTSNRRDVVEVVNPSGTTLTFTPSDGSYFTLEHNLNTTNLVWQMWRTFPAPDALCVPDDVVTSDPNKVTIRLDTPMFGRINLVRI